MNHKPPKLRTKAEKAAIAAAREERRRATSHLTIGDVLGQEVRAEQASQARRAELDDLGFTPINA